MLVGKVIGTVVATQVYEGAENLADGYGADGTMEPIEYAGMSTRQVDFETCRQILAEFLDNSFVVADP